MSWIRTKYLQFLEHCRQEGFGSACKTTLYKYEEMVPTEKFLDDLREVKPPDEGFYEFLDLGPENFHSHRLRHPLLSRLERAQIYFRQGYRMIAMVRDGEVVGDVWYVSKQNARHPRVHPHLDWFGIDLRDDGVYMFDMYVDAGKRGGGMTTYFLSRVLQMMRESGVRKSYGCFVSDNIPAMWMHRLSGYRELPRCIVRRFFLYEHVRTKA